MCLYNSVIEKFPQNPSIDEKIASIYMTVGKFDDAIASLNKSISMLTVPGIGMDIIIKGNYPVVKSIGENGPTMESGLEVGDRIVKVDNHNTKGWTIDDITNSIKGQAGTQVLVTIERDGIKKAFEKNIVRKNMINRKAATPMAMRSLIYRELKQYDNARNDAETAYAMDHEDGWAKSAMSINYIDQGRYQDALNILATLKDSPFDRMIEAIAYAKMGDMSKTIDSYSKIPDDYFSDGNTPHNNYKKALLETLKPYISKDKETAYALEQEGKYMEAIAQYARIQMFMDDEEKTKIFSHVGGLIAENPDLSEITEETRKYIVRGETLIKDSEFNDALKEYKKAIKSAPFVSRNYYSIASVYAELKDYASAIRSMNKYIELAPKASDIREAKDEIYKWELMLEKSEEKGK